MTNAHEHSLRRRKVRLTQIPLRGRAGFTLPELLVAIAIFLSVMGGVALLFNTTMRTVRQGYQAQEAFEEARGALKIIERDLTRAFVSREHGDFYSFYGNQIGFTFVGLAGPGVQRNEEVNLSRVTYVIHNVSGSRILQTIDETQRPVFALLRFVEPGATDLDSFPVDWNGQLADSVGGVNTLQDRLDIIVQGAVTSGVCAPGDTQCLETVENAAKRELWIQMLSGVDTSLPDIWAQLGLNPLDYVVTDSIVSDDPPQQIPFTGSTFFFAYRNLADGIDPDNANRPAVIPQDFVTWNSLSNVLTTTTAGTDIGSPFDPRLPQAVVTNFELFFESPYVGAPDFQRNFSQRIDLPTGFRRLPPPVAQQ